AWDKLTVAAANTFQPSGASAAAPAGPAAAAARPAAPDPFAPRQFARSLTAVVVAPGKALTAAAPFRSCAAARLGGQPVRLAAEDQASGLALVEADGLNAPAIASPVKAGSAAVGIVARGAGPDGAQTLLTLPGEAGGGAISAPLQPGAAGAPVFAEGALSGIVTGDPSARYQIAGVVIAARHRIADAAAVERFLKAQGVSLPAASSAGSGAGLGALAARHGRSILPITCGG
ncbi:MAG: serine protease, partial [Beijerinckiaceae bacterium]